MTDMSNPAARVEYWLNKARTANINRPISTVWCAVWSLDPDSDAGMLECYRRGMHMIELGEQSRRLAEQAPPRLSQAALAGFHEIEHSLAFFRHPTNLFRSMTEVITQAGWNSLGMVTALLDEGLQVGVEQIDDLLAMTASLKANVTAAPDIPAEVKMSILEHLDEVERALRRVRVTGTSTVQIATDGLLGTWVRAAYRHGSEFVNHPVSQAIFALINATSIVLGLTSDTLALDQSGFLELGNGDSD